MATLDHPGAGQSAHDHSIPPEYALLLFVLVALLGIVVAAWPS